jgi:hypothetical protein
MKLPTPIFIREILPKKIYKFSSNKISTPIAHFFVCVICIDEDIILVCCTSDKNDKNKRLIEIRNLHQTLVYVEPDEDKNGLSKDTWINCNKYFAYSFDEFAQMYDSNQIKVVGEVTEAEMEQIRLGLLASPDIDDNLKSKL